MQNGESTPRQIPHIHVNKCLAKSVSDDRKTMEFHFETDDGEQVMITINVGGLKSWRTMAIDAVNDAQRLELNPGTVPFRRPNSFGVASNQNFRGQVFVSFDPETPGESVFMIPVEAALNVAEQIRKEALGQMTPEQRAKEAGKKALLGTGSRLILPR